MSAPRPEGMSEEAAKARKLFEALCEPHETCEADGEHAWRECRTCLAREQLEYDVTVPLIKAMLADWDRLRADGATLREELKESEAAFQTALRCSADGNGRAIRTASQRDETVMLVEALLDGDVSTPACYAQRDEFELKLYALWVRLKIKLEQGATLLQERDQLREANLRYAEFDSCACCEYEFDPPSDQPEMRRRNMVCEQCWSGQKALERAQQAEMIAVDAKAEIDRLVARCETLAKDGATLRERVTQLEATIDLLSSDDEVKALIAGIEDVKAGRVTPFAGLPADRHGFAGLPEKDQPK